MACTWCPFPGLAGRLGALWDCLVLLVPLSDICMTHLARLTAVGLTCAMTYRCLMSPAPVSGPAQGSTSLV